MNNRSLNISRLHSSLLILFAVMLIAGFWGYQPVFAQGHNGNGPQIGVGGFVDEDGDGFNDLLPDSDGDGVPDAIDPDFRHHYADSLGNGYQMHVRGDSMRMEQHRLDNDSLHMRMHEGPGMFGPDGFGDPGQFHGEPGQYGPGDSSMHGGMCPDDSMGGGHHHGGGGMGPDGGGMGPGPGKIGDGDNPIDGSGQLGNGNMIDKPAPGIGTRQSHEMKHEEQRQ